MKTQYLIFLSFALLFSNCTNREPGTTFEWDFSSPKKFIYSYSQIIHGENQFEKNSPLDKVDMTSNGFLNITVKENQLADLSLTDMEVHMQTYDHDGTPNTPIDQKAPSTVIQEMNSKGKFKVESSDIIFDILFPLPPNDLKEGESCEIPLSMPFNANGSILSVKGQHVLSFVGYEELNGYDCAVLEGELEISEIDKPSELIGKYENNTTAISKYYFSLEYGHYVGADVKLTINALMDNTGDENAIFNFYMNSTSENIFEIRLLEIED
ncbi:MAG: hypothetical protein ABJG68_13735 [Crocinitomicaceae bacterium]